MNLLLQFWRPAAGAAAIVKSRLSMSDTSESSRQPFEKPAAAGVVPASPEAAAWRRAPATGRVPGMRLFRLSRIVLLACGFSFASQAQEMLTAIPGKADSRAVVSLEGMAGFQKQHGLTNHPGPRQVPRMPAPATNREPRSGRVSLASTRATAANGIQPAAFSLQPSPPPAITFEAIPDNLQFIPPDTHGAVGPDHVMTTLNSQVRIQDRNGAVLSTVSLLGFWSTLRVTDVFDPHVEYDPYGQRWIFTAAAEAFTQNSSILIGVSQTTNPRGRWNLYRVDADTNNFNIFNNFNNFNDISWADYPALGFNKDWIVVTVNMFPIFSSFRTFNGVNIYVFDKANLYTNGVGKFTLFQENSGRGFTMVPAVTYDPFLPTMHLVEVDNLVRNYLTTSSQLRISTITGPVGSEVLTLGSAFVDPTNSWGSSDQFNLFTGSLPQQGSFFGIDGDDSRVINAVYRNGSLWCAHNAFLPAVSPDHCAVQWYQFSPSGGLVQFGEIEDPTGVISYAYPSIAVNRNNDALLGFSRFSTNQFASANYAFRSCDDPPNTFRNDLVIKAGEAPYSGFIELGYFDLRWGDYSATVVDPVNDIDLWTIQEYAATPAFFGTNTIGRWGTWWAKVAVTNFCFQTEFASSAYTVREGVPPGLASVEVLNLGGAAGSVDFATSDGTAISGVDYIQRSGTLTFASGQTSTNITIIILDDPITNGNRTINLSLFNPNGGLRLGFLTNAVLTIEDDDVVVQSNVAGEFNFSAFYNTFGAYIVTENETFIAPCGRELKQIWLPDRTAYGAIVTVVRTNGSTGRVLVDYETASGGTAIPFVDFIPVSGTLVFDDFQMSTNFLVEVGGDFFLNGSAFIRLLLSNPRPAPEEEQIRPGYLRPTLGLGAESGILVLEINSGLIFFTGTGNTLTTNASFNFERSNYRVDEYSSPGVIGGYRLINIDVVLFPPGSGSVRVRTSDRPAGAVLIGLLNFQAGSDNAEDPGGPGFDVWPNPVYTDPALTTITNYADYISTNLILSFSTECRKRVTLLVTNDPTVEFNEDIVVWLEPLDQQPPTGLNDICYVTIVYDDQPAGAVDREWNPDSVEKSEPPWNAIPGADNVVEAVVVQPDGKTLLAGSFTHVNARPRNRVARMNFDGTVDTSFNSGTGADEFVNSLALYPTNSTNAGKILIAGGFTSYNGGRRNGVARLLADGTLDATFNPGNGANGFVRAAVLQPDGKVLVAGEFTQFNDNPRSGFARLNPDGSLDSSFDIGSGADGTVRAIGFTSDGLGGFKVLVGGEFTTVNGQFRPGIAQLNSDGSVDPNYSPGAGANGPVYALAVQTNGAVIIGGAFTEINAVRRINLARLNADGTLDTTFNPGSGPNDSVYGITLQPDGKALIGGGFTSYNSTRRMGLARLRPNGTLDTSFLDTAYNQFAGLVNTFSFEPPNYVNSIAVQPDGDVIIGGSFTTVGGNPSITAPLRNDWTVFTRADKRTRYNLARLIGGATPGPGNAEFDSDQYYADENAGTAFIKLQRTDGRLGSLRAEATNITGTAIGTDTDPANADFVSTNIFNTWAEMSADPPRPHSVGQVNPVYFQIPLRDDTLREGDESLDLRFLRQDSGVTLGGEFIPLGGAFGRAEAKLTISDNDFDRGIFNFSSAVYLTNESAGFAIITVIRTNGSMGVVSVDYFTRNSVNPPQATAGVDYTPLGVTTLTFQSGQSSRTFLVPIRDDTAVEFDENIDLVLTNATGGAKLPGGLPTSTATARVVIIDDDFPQGRLNFISPNFTNNEAEGVATITVNRTGGNRNAISVQYQTFDGSALSNVDYALTAGILTWNDGESAAKSFTVPLVADGLVEGYETLGLRLFDPRVQGVPNTTLLGQQTNATLWIQDGDAYGIVAFNQTFYQADENAGRVTITVVRTAGLTGSGTVSFSATPDSAQAGVDFVPTNGVLSFAPGEFSKIFQVQLVDDAVSDGNKAVTLNLFNPVNVSTGFPSQVSLVIVDNESFNEPAGSLDTALDANTQVNGPVYAIALQRTNGVLDGRLVIAGDFTEVNHVPRRGLARITTNGVLDASFDVGAGADGFVRAVAVQPDGKVLIGGFFGAVVSTNRNRVARLNTDGTLDDFFNPGAGADNPVYAIVLQPDDKILVGGAFSDFNGITRPGIVRLNTNGTVDLTFNTGAGPDDVVYAAALQNDGRVLIGGSFTSVNGVPRNRLARLNRDGSVDQSFDVGAGFDAPVRAILFQPDGRIIVGGSFTNVNGVARNYVARLEASGALDAGFMAGVAGANNPAYALALQADGKLVVGGDFTVFNGVTRNRLTRLNTDGTTDTSINFGSGANAFVTALVIQPDRKIVLGGGFTQFDGAPRNRLARIHGGAIFGSGSLGFVSASFLVNENAGDALITVRRQGGTAGSVSVDYATSAGTAVAGVDYTETSGTLVFPEGETFNSFVVSVSENAVVNPNKTVNLSLSNFVGVAVGAQPTATLTILNDESLIRFSTTSYSVNEGAVGGRAIVTVVRDGATNGSVSVDFVVTNGTAVAGADYLPLNGTLVFAPGQTEKNFSIAILDDALVEGNETVQLFLLNPAGAAALGLATANLTIVDNDFAHGTLRFSTATYSVSETGTNALITVIRTNGSAGVVSVEYATIGGTATAGLDYAARSGTIAFADGQVSSSFLIPIFPDTVIEPGETVSLRLLNPQGGAILGTPINAVLTIVNVGGVPLPGNVDGTFDPGAGANSLVHVVAVQPDGKILVGGAFTSFNGTNRNRIARLESDGMLQDAGFNPGSGANGLVWTLALQPDDKVLLGGAFTAVNGVGRVRIARLNSNGSVDSGFQLPSGVNATVYAIAVQADGGILLGGPFNNLGAMGLARLLPNGSVDGSFNPGAGANGAVYALALQADGKILAGGDFTTVGSANRSRIARLNSDGSVDNSFDPGPGADGPVFAVAVQLDGKIIIAGDFSIVGVLARTRVARLNADGSVDSAFVPPTDLNGVVHSVAVQPNGKVVLGGDFTTVGGISRNRIARLNAGGSLDTAFNTGTGADSSVYSVALQPDGRVVIGGDFTSVNGVPRNGVARLGGDPPAVALARFNLPTVLGNRQVELMLNASSGATFAIDASVNLLNWTPLATNTAFGGTLTFTDTNAPTFNTRFYRARQVGP